MPDPNDIIRGPVLDNRPWPRVALAMLRDSRNPDKMAVQVEIVDERPFPRQHTGVGAGLYLASVIIPMDDLAGFLASALNLKVTPK